MWGLTAQAYSALLINYYRFKIVVTCMLEMLRAKSVTDGVLGICEALFAAPLQKRLQPGIVNLSPWEAKACRFLSLHSSRLHAKTLLKNRKENLSSILLDRRINLYFNTLKLFYFNKECLVFKLPYENIHDNILELKHRF